MVLILRILFIMAVISMMVAAEAPSCRAMKQGTTQCNPYSLFFLKATALKKRTAFLRHSPVMEKAPHIAEKIRIKNGTTLHNFINQYIKREERLYYKVAHKKQSIPQKKTPSKKPKKITKQIVKKEEKRSASSHQASVPPKKILEEKKDKTLKQTVQKEAPLEIPKVVVLAPQKKPPAPMEEVHHASKEKQVSTEETLPAELLPDKQEKETKITLDVKAEFAVYEVKKGDSLIGIAKRFGVEADILMEINNLRRDTLLKEGQILHIPRSQEDVDAIDNATYIVKKGDTLSGIAKHFHVKIKDLKKYNKIRKKSIIHIGQILILPVPKKLMELKRIEEKKRKIALKKKRERARLARIALKKAERARFLKVSKGLKRKLSVTATAYTSHRGQTDKTPFLAAWNNRIRPGMKIIAVSRDLITKYGITNGKKVRISGLKGIYTVRDKMNKKWRRKIDIYMGTSRWRALRWGRRRVTLYY